MKRRTLLVGTAAATATTLSGCINHGGAGGGTNASENAQNPESGGELGATRVTRDDVRVTVRDAFTSNTLIIDRDYQQAGDGERFLLVEIQVRNNADGEREIPLHGDLSVRDSEDIRQTQLSSRDATLSEPVSQTYAPSVGFSGTAVIDPGSQLQGWAAYRVETEATEFRIELPELLTENDDTVAWDVSVPVGTGVVLEESVEMPEDPRSGRPVEVTASVTNTGLRTARVDRHFGVPTYVGDVAGGSIETGVGAGETESVTIEFTPAKTGPYPFQSTTGGYADMDVRARQFAFGETWDLATGLDITVFEPVLTDSVTYDSSDGDDIEATPSDGKQFLSFDFEAESDDEHYWDPMFVATSSGLQADTFDDNRVSYILDGYDETLSSPPLGGPATGIGGVADWPDHEGPMVMEVPSGFTTADLTIRLQDDDTGDPDRYAAEWKST